jgi:hypothetical protein
MGHIDTCLKNDDDDDDGGGGGDDGGCRFQSVFNQDQ